MTLAEFLKLLDECPIIASVQTNSGSAVDDPSTLSRLAKASTNEGVKVLRVQGVENLRVIRAATKAATIGLIKRSVPGSNVYITPTVEDVVAVASTGSELVAIDATDARRKVTVHQLVDAAHSLGLLVVADCDSINGLASGADIFATTLSGYTGTNESPLPDFDLVRALVAGRSGPVLAEGRYATQHQVRGARLIGAAGVVVGGALNDPVKQTRVFLDAVRQRAERVAAFDIGGTWLRFAVVNQSFQLSDEDRVPSPRTKGEREAWMREKLRPFRNYPVGISTGGTIEPKTRTVIEASDLIPDYVGTDFRATLNHDHVMALNDGIATAWGHACRAENIAGRVATLTFGTGVGFGLVGDGQILMGSHGEYPRINDLPFANGLSIEENLQQPNADRQPIVEHTIRLVDSLFQPQAIVVCGGRIADLQFTHPKVQCSPFGANAGLCGAASLVFYPPFGGQI